MAGGFILHFELLLLRHFSVNSCAKITYFDVYFEKFLEYRDIAVKF